MGFEPKKFGELYLPSYDGRSILNLTSLILTHYGSKSATMALNFSKELQNTMVVIIVDGLGYLQLKEARKRLSIVDAALSKAQTFEAMTTVFPSTTSTVLTSFNTGLPPAQHGIIGFSMFVKELGAVVNTITFSPASEKGEGAFESSGLQASYLYPQKTIYQELSSLGVKSKVFTPNYLANTVLSRALYNGAEKFKFSQLSDMFVNIRKELLQKTSEPRFITAYWSGVDTISHKYGPMSDEHDAEISAFFFMLFSQLVEKCAGAGATLIVTADHGHVNIPEGCFHDLSSDYELLSNLAIPPTGDSRALFLFPKNEHSNEVIQKRFSETSVILDKKEAIELGLFGVKELSPSVSSRLGDKLVLPFKQHSYVYRYPTFEYKPMIGNHGGLSQEELLIPLLVYEL